MPIPDDPLRVGADGVSRCWWCGDDPLYVAYHDTEWGMPVADDTRLFEKVSLEGFQAGLSWLTILRKRENFRAAFAGFDVDRVARWGSRQVERMLRDEGIVRHRGKIESVLNNARRAKALRAEHGSLAAFLWGFEPEDDAFSDVPAVIPESKALGKALKKEGWSFVGPTTMYALMQAMGMVNDHVPGCAVRERVAAARARFRRPTSGARR